ncbi:hypothetical protein ABZT03_14850 [Streptomyces sp. NPDC005574]|uniref:hypothetical protein n=1 Tax=Streptomyces sp. NPDC005574 TaxID=3156891 RepID=UPI0033BA83CB
MSELNSVPSVGAMGDRAIAVGGDVEIAVTGDNNIIHHYLIFGGGGGPAGSMPTDEETGAFPAVKVKVVVPVLIGLVNWVGQAVSMHPGRRLVQSYVEQALHQVGAQGLVAYGEEQDSGENLLLFTGAADMRMVGAFLLSELDRMMAADWANATRKDGYLLPQLRLVLHEGFGEYDGSRISSPSFVKTIRAHAETTALHDAYAGDTVGVVALVTNEAYDAGIYEDHCGSGQRWIPFSQSVAGASPLGFWARGALGDAASAAD